MHFGVELLFAVAQRVHGGDRDAGFGCDLLHARTFVAASREQALGRVDQVAGLHGTARRTQLFAWTRSDRRCHASRSLSTIARVGQWRAASRTLSLSSSAGS